MVDERYMLTLGLAKEGHGPVGGPHQIEVTAGSPARAMIAALMQLPGVLADAWEQEAAASGDPAARIDAQMIRAISERINA